MSDSHVFWERVNAALDERRDPLADEQVQMLVAEDPARLDELLALRERIEHLPVSRPRRFVSKVAALAAAVLVVGTAAWFAVRDRTEPFTTVPLVATTSNTVEVPPEVRPLAIDSSASRSRVISFRSHVVIESPNTRSTIDFDGERLVRSREYSSPPSNDDSASSQPAFVASIVHLNP